MSQKIKKKLKTKQCIKYTQKVKIHNETKKIK